MGVRRTVSAGGFRLEQIGGAVMEKLHSVAALGHGRALDDEALKLDSADFRAILLLLASDAGSA